MATPVSIKSWLCFWRTFRLMESPISMLPTQHAQPSIASTQSRAWIDKSPLLSIVQYLRFTVRLSTAVLYSTEPGKMSSNTCVHLQCYTKDLHCPQSCPIPQAVSPWWTMTMRCLPNSIIFRSDIWNKCLALSNGCPFLTDTYLGSHHVFSENAAHFFLALSRLHCLV